MSDPTRPRGREAVRGAVLDATRELLAERGPAGFSVREIAQRAGVNHALVHRHFGTKEDVLREVLGAEADAVVAALADAGVATAAGGQDVGGQDVGADLVERALEVLAQRPSYWRTLAHAVLESPDAAVPGTAATTDLFRGLWRDVPASGAVGTAVAAATALGWLVFRDFVEETVGADSDEVRRAVAAHVARLVGPAGPAGPQE